MNFGSAASQGFQQQNFSAPNLSATFLVEDIAGDNAPANDADSFTTNQPNVRVEPRTNVRTQPQANRQPARLREQVVIEETNDVGEVEVQPSAVERGRRSNRAGTF